MRHSDIAHFKTHLDTAELLLKGVKESLNEEGNRVEGYYNYVIIPPEHSDESIVRRCVQIRQELLQVIKKLRK